jgi:hypothetical protein
VNFVKNHNAMIKGLMKQELWMNFLSNKRNCLFKKQSNEELNKLLALEKGKVDKFDQELVQSKKTTCSLKSSIDAL